MKRIIYVFLIFCLYMYFSCSQSKNVITNAHPKDTGNNYLITKINLLDDKVYIIYAQRKDSIYKIVSKKESIPMLHCMLIKEKEEYPLKLEMFYPIKELLGIPVQTSLTVNGVYVDENIIVEIEETSHYSLYHANNLKGLCLIK